MDSSKGKSRANRDDKQATAKLEDQIEKVNFIASLKQVSNHDFSCLLVDQIVGPFG